MNFIELSYSSSFHSYLWFQSTCFYIKMFTFYLQSESFDAVIEKATLDALLVNEKSAWNISEEGEAKVGACLSEASRIMRRSGARFLSFTFSPLHLRGPVFAKECYNWSVAHRVIIFYLITYYLSSNFSAQIRLNVRSQGNPRNGLGG